MTDESRRHSCLRIKAIIAKPLGRKEVESAEMAERTWYQSRERGKISKIQLSSFQWAIGGIHTRASEHELPTTCEGRFPSFGLSYPLDATAELTRNAFLRSRKI